MRYKMSRANRVKQFALFAALKGYDDMITEQGMERFKRIILAEEDAQVLSDKLSQFYQGLYVMVQYQGSTSVDKISDHLIASLK